MAGTGAYIVVDIGKTLSKVSLWCRYGTLVCRQVRPNPTHEIDGIRRLDAEGIGEWLRATLREWAGHPVEAIIPVAHGAAFAAIGEDGLLFAPLDYEQPIPGDVMAAYRAERDALAVTGSPPCPTASTWARRSGGWRSATPRRWRGRRWCPGRSTGPGSSPTGRSAK
ncbi:hypothetical protein ACFSLT_22975 [Novosphingobium resinovorum]